MTKLHTIKPILKKLPSLIGSPPSDEAARSRDRDRTQVHRAWYKTAKWQALRWSVLVRDQFTCAMCKRLCAGKGEAVADHIIPHRGDEAMFWDADNLQCLCKSCHDGAKAKQERQQGFR